MPSYVLRCSLPKVNFHLVLEIGSKLRFQLKISLFRRFFRENTKIYGLEDVKMVKCYVVILWITSCSWFKSIEALKTRQNGHFSSWSTDISQQWKTAPPNSPSPPLRISHFWANGSKFSNSVENTWKYIEFATFYVRTGKIWILRPDPPPIALSKGCPIYWKNRVKFSAANTFLSHWVVPWV